VVHIPLEARDLFLLESIQTRSGTIKTFIFQEQNSQGYVADQSPPHTAKVKNEWSYTSTPQINGMHGHGFTFTLTRELKLCNLTVKNNSPQCSSSLKVTGHP
jgi:hypothetical protein